MAPNEQREKGLSDNKEKVANHHSQILLASLTNNNRSQLNIIYCNVMLINHTSSSIVRHELALN